MKTEREKQMWQNVMKLIEACHFKIEAYDEGWRYLLTTTEEHAGNVLAGAFMHALYVFCEAGGFNFAIGAANWQLQIYISPNSTINNLVAGVKCCKFVHIAQRCTPLLQNFENMNILTLSIKQKYFDEIKAGTKKDEFREIRPSNFKKYARYLYKGKEYETDDDIPEDAEIEVVPVKYDAIKLLTGEYKGKRPCMIVEVKDAEIQVLTDDDDNDIIYEHDGEEYIAAQIRYSLGDIIEQ